MLAQFASRILHMFDLIDANTTDMGVIAALVAVVLILKYLRLV